MIVFTNIVRV